MSTAKFAVGKAGHLFLNNDHNAVFTQITGQGVFRADFFQRLACVHAERRNRCQQLGIEYLHILIPNKETSLRAYLPDGITYEEFGPTPANRYLREHPEVADFTFYDPDALSRSPSATEFYPRQDSHWKTAGAVTYVDLAFQKLRRSDTSPFGRIALERYQKSVVGDLGTHAGLAAESVDDVRIANPANTIRFAGNINNQGYLRHQVSTQEACFPERLLCLHDSFTQMLFDVLGNLWSETLTIHIPDLSWDLVEAYRPATIIFMQIERFLPRIPTDSEDICSIVRRLSAQKNVPPLTADYLETILIAPGKRTGLNGG